MSDENEADYEAERARIFDREYEHRSGDRKYRRRQALRLFMRIEKLYNGTDPSVGEESAKGKDFAARQALGIAGEFCQLMAGWAVDHAVGKAIQGQDLLPVHTQMQNPDFVAMQEISDQHEHERAGSTLNRRWSTCFDPDPQVTRAALLNLIQANSSGLPLGMRLQVVDGLRALAYAEVLPVFAPNPDPYAKRKWRELNAQLRALTFVEYRVSKGIKRGVAQQEVGDAYGVSQNTIISWGQRIRKELGDLNVADALQQAKNYASHVAAPLHQRDQGIVEYAERLYGTSALAEKGAASRKIAAEIAADKAKRSR